jgi:hypothetical protein
MSAPTPDDATLMGVPPEMRLMIYDELFISDDFIVIHSPHIVIRSRRDSQSSQIVGNYTSNTFSSVGLLHSLTIIKGNRQLYAEAVRHFYSKNRFLIHRPTQLASDRHELLVQGFEITNLFRWWTENLGSNAQDLKNITITLPACRIAPGNIHIDITGIIEFLLQNPGCKIDLVVNERGPLTQNQQPTPSFNVQAMMAAIKIILANAENLRIPKLLKLYLMSGILLNNQGIGGYFSYFGNVKEDYVVQPVTNNILMIPRGLQNLPDLPERVLGLIFNELFIDPPRILELQYTEGENDHPRMLSPSQDAFKPSQMAVSKKLYEFFMDYYWKVKKIILRHVISRPQQGCELQWVKMIFHHVNCQRNRWQTAHLDLIFSLADTSYTFFDAPGPAPLDTWRLELGDLLGLEFYLPRVNRTFEMDVIFHTSATEETLAVSHTVPLTHFFDQMRALIRTENFLADKHLLEVKGWVSFWFDGYGKLKDVGHKDGCVYYRFTYYDQTHAAVLNMKQTLASQN